MRMQARARAAGPGASVRGQPALRARGQAHAHASACMTRTTELHDDARLRLDAQFSSLPLPLPTIDAAMESSFDGLSTVADHVQDLSLLLAEHQDKLQQVHGGVVHRLQSARCRAGRASPRRHRHLLTWWSCSTGCSPPVEPGQTGTSLLAPLHSASLRAPRAAKRDVRRDVRVGGGGVRVAGTERAEG